MNSPAGLPCVSSSSPRPEETTKPETDRPSLTEEMEKIIHRYEAAIMAYMKAPACSEMEALAAVELLTSRQAVSSRLSSLVSELEGYRKDALTWRARNAAQSQAIRTQAGSTLTTTHRSQPIDFAMSLMYCPECGQLRGHGHECSVPKQTSVPRQTEPL